MNEKCGTCLLATSTPLQRCPVLSHPIHTQPLAGWPHDVLAWSVARQTAQWELARRREEVFVLAKHNVKFISYSINNVAMTGAIINFTENVFPSICITCSRPTSNATASDYDDADD